MMKYKYIGEHPTVMLVGESLATITKGDIINLVGAPSPDFVLQEKIKKPAIKTPKKEKVEIGHARST